jgi:uncharacterized protein (TIGR03437 family)
MRSRAPGYEKISIIMRSLLLLACSAVLWAQAPGPFCLCLLLATCATAQTPTIGAVVNAASYYPGAGVAPGSIVSIFGTNLATQTAAASSLPLPTSLADVSSVSLDSTNLPLFYVSPTQINALLPSVYPGNIIPVQRAGLPQALALAITNALGASAPQSIQIVPASPGIFTTNASGSGPAVVTQSGNALTIWCTGLGAVDAAGNTLATPTVTIGGVQQALLSSVQSPQYAGEYQVAVQIAPNTPTGSAVPIQIQIDGETTLANVTVAITGNAPAFQTLNNTCTLTSTTCTEINLSATDPFSTAGAFGGYADATVRQDPLTGMLWMAYSWPHTIPSGRAGVAGTQVLDIHLAYSTDGGNTWNYKGPLYTSQPMLDQVTGATDHTANEVMNLYPQVINGVTYWYGIHSNYNVPVATPGGPGSAPYSKRWAIAMAPGTATDGPIGLATATLQYLGEPDNIYPQDFPSSVNLGSLDPEVNGCTTFYEPALIMSGNNLYLFLACTPDSVANRFYAVFKTTDPRDHPGNWTWSYVEEGSIKFANEKDAVSIGRFFPGTTTTYITQMDLAPSKNPGIIMVIATAAFDNVNGKNSNGCVAAELASIDPPKFVYNAQGQVQVDAYLASPDSPDTGPGSCTYSPYSATGMILAHRQSSKALQNGGFFTFLMQSLLFP